MVCVSCVSFADEGDEIHDLSDAERHFVDLAKPLLVSRCLTCHGTEKNDGGLRLDSRQSAIEGGDTGPAMVPGKPEESLIVVAVRHADDSLQMPPKEKLADREIAILERWIQDGAPWPATMAASVQSEEAVGDAWSDPRNPIVRIFAGERLDLWSFAPVRHPDVPTTARKDWAKQELDHFVLASMEQDEITPAPPADSRTLIRRLYFDLTGLPPTSQQVADFEAAQQTHGDAEALNAAVDGLLDSPRFGEHFARLWLDVVRYSDSNGFDWDEFRPQAWRFRDYVIRSLNADKPFDRFIAEQLAGDELIEGAPQNEAEQDCLIATGYLRLGPYDNAAGLFNEQDRSRAELLEDLTETTAGAFLGLTFSCCRCHDHKYDPLSQADHYRLRAFFAATRFADDMPLNLAKERSAIEMHNDRIDSQAKVLRDKRDAIPESEQAERELLQREISALDRQRLPYTHGLMMSDNADNVDATHIFFQGDHKSPRDAVAPGFLTAFDPKPASITPSKNPNTTGRRLTLANWIGSSQNPLTARVFVNRIWQALMGQALVATPNDFGLAGSQPENDELLDWLAVEFMQQGWSIKHLVRTIVNSATYRQSPSFDTAHHGLRTPRRLSAEQLRDAMLMVSGLLTSKSGGPPIWPDLPKEVLVANPAFLDDNETRTKGWYPSPKDEQYCRSLFLVQKRNTRVPLLEMFDLPDNSTPCARRQVSTVAPQALMLLNSPLATESARSMATLVQQMAGADPKQQVQVAFEKALQRSPSEAELIACQRLLSEHSLTELCRVLLNLNEFAYID